MTSRVATAVMINPVRLIEFETPPSVQVPPEKPNTVPRVKLDQPLATTAAPTANPGSGPNR